MGRQFLPRDIHLSRRALWEHLLRTLFRTLGVQIADLFWGGGCSLEFQKRGNTIRGNRTESLWEGNLPLRGSLRGPLHISKSLWKPLKTSENLSENLWNPLKTLPLRDPLRGRFPSQRLSVLLPLIVLPLKLSPRDAAFLLTVGSFLLTVEPFYL